MKGEIPLLYPDARLGVNSSILQDFAALYWGGDDQGTYKPAVH